ncbi:Predicted ATPase [Marinomonas polaris DSM 16579]|uniref:Predicted ATPase n=2 Tax=Marinomonas TaxID=28253 RepID=A0A1M5CS71_9GAMM|nr:Predicted ATPase [Marinomonas polaris DSM 16579]
MHSMEPLPYLKEIKLKKNLIESFDHYPFSIAAIKGLRSIEFGKDVTIFVGENGSGKSTLLEAIAVGLGFNAEGGSKNFSFGTRKTHSELHSYLQFSRSFKRYNDGFFLRAESFYNVATHMDELDEEVYDFGYLPPPPEIKNRYGGNSLHNQSHGESFISLLFERFSGNGLYLLDEPESALSPAKQLSVLSRMRQLVNNQSQFIMATHSPILMAYPDAKIYQIDQSGIYPIQFEDTDHYQITKAFLNNPEPMLKELFFNE